MEVSSNWVSSGAVGEMTSLFSLNCSLEAETCSLGRDAGGKAGCLVGLGGDLGGSEVEREGRLGTCSGTVVGGTVGIGAGL